LTSDASGTQWPDQLVDGREPVGIEVDPGLELARGIDARIEPDAGGGGHLGSREREAKTQQRTEQALPGALDDLPMVEIGRVVRRRDDAVVAASTTERVAAWIVFHQPVAGAPLGVDAMDELLGGESRRLEGVAIGLERDEHVRRVHNSRARRRQLSQTVFSKKRTLRQ
jgi:hypothetical protein